MGSPGRTVSDVVVVFDFDKTIIDCDSDNWVVDGLDATESFDSLLPTMPWNTVMDEIMRELHFRGKSVDSIADCLCSAPLDPNTVAAIKTAYALGCDVRIVSDANAFFITTILQHHGLLHCFTEINTNPSHVDGEGRLRISPYHDFHRDPHGCPLCPPNMCKGRIIERIQAEVGPQARFVYVGDGTGDFCSSLKLSASDFVMPRKDYPLWELIQTRGGGKQGDLVLKAKVHEWRSWAEQYETLLRLILEAASTYVGYGAANGAVASDHDKQTVSIGRRAAPPSHELMIKPLPVHCQESIMTLP